MRIYLVLFILFFSFSVFSQELDNVNNELLQQINTLKETIKRQQEKIDTLEKIILELKEKSNLQEIKDLDKNINEKLTYLEFFKDLKLELGINTILQATYNANGNDSPKEDSVEVSYSLDLALSKSFKDYGKALVRFEYGNGEGVEKVLKLFSNVNYDINNEDRVTVSEVWYEHYFSFLPLSLTFGKLDPTLYIDNNTYANDENTQFLGRIFRNSPVVEFPDNSFGLNLNYKLNKNLEFDILALEGDSDWHNSFQDMFFAGQFSFKPNLFSNETNLRLFGWYNKSPHTKWLDADSDKEKGFGFGLSFDQEIFKNLGIFLRYGWQNPKVYLNSNNEFSLNQSFSLGFELNGNLWKRENDTLGLGFGKIFPSKDYKEAKINEGIDIYAKDETHLELYYNFKINENLFLTPDLQIIFTPFGKDANSDDTITVVGLRAHYEF